MDEIERLSNSIGALAEIMGMFYRDLLKQGFEPEDAIELTKTYLTALYIGREF